MPQKNEFPHLEGTENVDFDIVLRWHENKEGRKSISFAEIVVHFLLRKLNAAYGRIAEYEARLARLPNEQTELDVIDYYSGREDAGGQIAELKESRAFFKDQVQGFAEQLVMAEENMEKKDARIAELETAIEYLEPNHRLLEHPDDRKV